MKERSKTFTMRFLALALSVVTMLTMFPALNANAASIDDIMPVAETAEQIYGRLGIARTQQEVWAMDGTGKLGTIFAHEGFTIRESYGDGTLDVEYSTPRGTQRGFIVNPNVYVDYDTCWAVANRNATVYYTTIPSLSETIGSISEGENVIVLARQHDWDYIEYNSPSGRKRGYVEHYKLTWINYPANVRDLPCNEYYPEKVINLNRAVDVYAGPSDEYFRVGSVGVSDNPLHYCWEFSEFGSTWAYVEYTVTSTGKIKSGFIKIS